MTDKYSLLADLSSLVRKHGPDTFADLARLLRDRESMEALVSILESAEAAGRKARVGEPRPRSQRGRETGETVRRVLADIEITEPDKAQTLSALYDAIQAKRVFRTVGDFQRFARDNGLPPITATSRDRAAATLLRGLAHRPLDDVRAMLARDIRPSGAGDRSLEGWTHLILGDRDPGPG